jgi:hypothetical protein
MPIYEENEIDYEKAISDIRTMLNMASGTRNLIFKAIDDKGLNCIKDVSNKVREADKAVLSRQLSYESALTYFRELSDIFEDIINMPVVEDIINSVDTPEHIVEVIAQRIFEMLGNISRCMVVVKTLKPASKINYPRDFEFKSDMTYVADYPKEVEHNVAPDVVVELILPSNIDKSMCIIVDDILVPDYHYYSDRRWACAQVITALQKYTIDCRAIADATLCKSALIVFSVALSENFVSQYEDFGNYISFNRVLSGRRKYAIRIDKSDVFLQFVVAKDDKYYPELTLNVGINDNERKKIRWNEN